MEARTVDPTDQVSETDAPAYRVYFWPSPSESEEWELSGTDVDEVLDWVRLHGQGRPHSLWVSVPSTSGDAQGVHLIRLRGIDPPAPAESWPEWARETR